MQNPAQNDVELLQKLLGIPKEHQWVEGGRDLAAARVRGWLGQYGEDVIKRQRRGFLLTLSNQDMKNLRKYL